MSGDIPRQTGVDRKPPRRGAGFPVLLACAILVPLAFFAVGASSAWKTAEDEALFSVERIADLLHEHALRTFEAHSAALAAMDQRIADMSWSEVRAQEAAIGAFAGALKKQAIAVADLALIDPSGRVAVSTFAPAEVPEDLRSSDFADHLRGDASGIIFGPLVRGVHGGGQNALARPRSRGDGGFVISFFSPTLFETFYDSLRSDPSDSIALMHENGSLIARAPENRDQAPDLQEERLAEAMRSSGRATASLRATGSLGEPSSIHVARRIGDLPVLVLYGRRLSSLPGQWLLRILPYGLLWLTSTTFLVFMTWRISQATRREQEAYASLAVETANSLAKDEANLRMTRMMDANVFGVVTFSEDRIVQANDAFLRMVGLTRQEFNEHGFAWRTKVGDEIGQDQKLLTHLRERGACPPFETEIALTDGRTVPALIGATLYDRAPFTWICFVLDLTERREREAQQIFVMRELNHRTKNLLTVIRSVAGQIARTGNGWSDFRDRFNDRLTALASAHDLLVESNWRGASLKSLINSQFSQFHDLDGGQLVTRGEDMNISPRAAQAIAMALYELMTNAVKYGALAAPNGRIEVSWEIEPLEEPLFAITWKERCGPLVAHPERRGFGHIVIADMTARSLCGDVEYSFEPDGVQWRLTAPLSQVEDRPDGLTLESIGLRPV